MNEHYQKYKETIKKEIIKKDIRFQTYKNIFKDYLNFFHQRLFDPDNEEAHDYLLKRGLKQNIIEEFKLG